MATIATVLQPGRTPPLRPEYRITDLATLHQALGLLPRRRRFVVELPGLSNEAAQTIGDRASELSAACGCGTGAAFLLAAILLDMAFDLGLWSTVRHSPFLTIGGNLVVCGLAIGAGKAVGVHRARRKLRRLLSEIKARLSPAGMILNDQDQQRERLPA
jgi:hypothetical protein